MKFLTKLAAAALLLGVSAVSANADHTNLLQTIRIQLLGFSQGATSTAGTVTSTGLDSVPVGSRQVIAVLGTATGNTFSPGAKLILVTPLNVALPPSVQVRDGSSTVDVTGFFWRGPVSDSLTSSYSNSRNGRSTSSNFSIQDFILQNDEIHDPLSLHFSVRGIFVASTSTSPNAGTSNELEASVTGSGDSNGNLLLLQGWVSVRGRDFEVVPDGGGGGV